jgi:hypothetical protein
VVKVQVLRREMIDDRFYNGDVYFGLMREGYICKIVPLEMESLFKTRICSPSSKSCTLPL